MPSDRTNPLVTDTASESEQLKTTVQIELTGALVRQSRNASFIAPIGSLFMVWVQFGHAPLSTILMWFALVSLPDVATVATSLRFDHVPKTPKTMRFWHARQVLIHTAAGIAWGSALLFFITENTGIEQEMKVILILMVVSALAVIPVSSSIASLIGFQSGIAAIPMFHYLFSPHPDHFWLALGTVILTSCTLHFGLIAHRQLKAHVRSSAANDRLATALTEANMTITATNRALEDKNAALTLVLEKLNTQATHDELTGLYNRRYILQQLENALQDIRRYHTVCSIAMIDIDHFKKVNDRYGHGIGDMVLKGFADRIQRELRQGDIFSRYGGEEFLLLLPMTELEDAGKLVDRLRQLIENSPIIQEPVSIHIQSSFGVAQILPTTPIHDSIARADAALYRAKDKGRNRVELAEKTM